MHIRLLGPVEASLDGRPVLLGTPQQRAVVAMLALQANRTVSADSLIAGLWGERAPASALKLVQLYVSQLRKVLRGDDAEIVTRGRGYELQLAADRVDAARFEQLVTEAVHPDGTRNGAAREALALWRGTPLADIAGEPFAGAEIRRLEELRLRAAELAIDADLASGRHGDVTGELEALVAEHPLRETLHAQRMLALYRCNRQADALEAYREARAALVQEVGVEPGPELRRLHAAILRQDTSLEPPAADAAELPGELVCGTPLVGRGRELGRLREHWRRAQAGAGRLVLVTGQRGMGKTRLAAELAAEVRNSGGAVLYASGAAAAGAAGAAPAQVQASRRPTLMVLDDIDRAAGDPGAALDALVDDLLGLPVLVMATAENAVPTLELRAAATLVLSPLHAEDVRTVARVYAGSREDVELPLGRLVEASRGVPEHVHRLAAEWARTKAARRLNAAAETAATERAGLRAAEDDLAGSVVELQAVRERAEQRDGGGRVVACPFKGLAAFDLQDAGVFFGRERLVAEMVARLAGAPLIGIVGPSGSGKSSALRAGLLASLAAGVLPGSERWATALLRPGGHPLGALEQAIARAAPRDRLVVAVDQFEETFTACREESDRAAFVDALVARARDPGRRTLVIVALRADFYGRCAAYPELSRLLGACHVLVGPMRRDELRRAIELPARRAGLRVEPDLVDALIADVEGEPGALPLLSTALVELWRHRDGRHLRMSAYEQAGGVRGAVARLAESAYARLDPGRQEIARRILLRLAGEGEGESVVRRSVPVAEFESGAGDVLTTLAGDRLVTIGEGEVEVAHEALLREWPRLRGWLEEDAQGRRLHRHLAEAAREWDGAGRDAGELYRGARLAAAIEWSAAHEGEFNPVERVFLDDSRAAAERSHRRLRAVLAGVAALLAVTAIAGLVALDQRGTARDEAVAAEAQRLGARALVENDLDRSLLLARQGVALDDVAQTRGNLLAALLKSPAAIGVLRGAGERMWTLELSPDERTLAAGDPAGNVFLFDTRTRRRVAAFKPAPGNSWIVDLAFSPDGRRLAVAHDTPRGNVVIVLDSRTHRVVARLAPPRDGFVYGLRYTADGQMLDVNVCRPFEERRSLFTRFDARTGRHLLGPRAVTRRGCAPVLATGDGRRLVIAGEGETTVRDASTLRVLERVPVGGGRDALPFTRAYALSGDDRTLAIGDANGSVRLLDLSTGAVRRASGRHGEAITELCFAPGDRTLVTAGDDGEVIVWDVRRATAVETLSGHARGVRSPQVTRDGKTLYTAGLDGTVFIWDLAGSRRLGRPFTAGEGNDQRPQLALSSDGLIAMGQDDGAISLADGKTLARRKPLPVVDTGQVLGIGFVPGSHRLVVGGPDGFLALVDTDSRRVIRRLAGHSGRIYTPGISADGRLLATGSDDNSVRIWSLPDGRALGAPLRFDRLVFDTQLSPDGRWLTVVLIDPDFENGTIEVRDVRSRRRVHRIRVADYPGFTRFSPDGRLMAVGNRFGRSQVWSTETWKPVTRFLVGDASGILAAQISPDGRTLATGSDTGTVQLWDIETEQAIAAPLPGGPNRAAVPYFTPDGARLIVSYDTGRAYVWDLRPESLVRHACQVAGRRLTRAEWDELLPGRDYAPAC